LRHGIRNADDERTLDVFDTQLARTGAELTRGRLRMLERLSAGGPVEGESSEAASFLAALIDGLLADRGALAILERPWIKPADRRAAALALAEKSGSGTLVRDFVGLVAERGRLDHLAAILAAYRDLIDADLSQARAQVRSAVAMTDAEKAQLTQHGGHLAHRSLEGHAWRKVEGIGDRHTESRSSSSGCRLPSG
jgi:hypothetical protein